MRKRLTFVLFFIFVVGCAADDSSPVDESTSTPPTCEGPKCDGITDRFRDAYSDMREVELEDLTVVGAGFATDELNGVLADVPYSTIELGATAIYGDEEELLGQTTVHDLNSLRSGLTDRLGEDAFATRIVELRSNEAAANDLVWAESHFRIGPDLGHDWGVDIGDVVGAVGFQANATVETVVITPHEGGVEAVAQNPLSAIRETRGWVMPRSVDDIQSMVPGESLAMSADGALGFNLGVGVPFLIGTVSNLVTLHARLSFGARVALRGRLDVQLVRGDGDTAWVDVGVRNQELRHFSVALTTGYGVEGLPEVDVDLGVVDLDVDDLAEKALRKQLNKRLTPELSASQSSAERRLTVARFRFDLSRATEAEVEQAIAQAIRGDIRLAQALANRGDNGVVQELDLVKDSRSEANYLGFRFLGMEFYRANNFDTGTIQIEANGENQTLLFSELEQKSGLFFTDRDLAWRKLVSLRSADGRLVDASVNTRLTLKEKDKFLTRDQMLDHVDNIGAYFVGHEALFNEVAPLTDTLAEFVDTTCGRVDNSASFQERQEFRECLATITDRPEVAQQEATIIAKIDEVLANGVRAGFAPDQTSAQDYARELLMFKLALSRLNDRPDVSLDGPEGQMVTQVRFSDDALHNMMAPGREGDFRIALENSLRRLAARRTDDFENKTDHIDGYIENREERLDEMALMFFDASIRFAEFQEIADSSLDGREIGTGGSMVLIPVENEEDMTLATIAEHKGDVVEGLLPRLVDRSDDGILRDLDEPGAFIVGYAMLDMVEPSEIELLTSFTFDDEDAPDDLQLYSRGSSQFIDAGQFNLETLLGAE